MWGSRSCVLLLLMHAGYLGRFVGGRNDNQCSAADFASGVSGLAEPPCVHLHLLQTDSTMHANRIGLTETIGHDNNIFPKKASDVPPAPPHVPKGEVALLHSTAREATFENRTFDIGSQAYVQESMAKEHPHHTARMLGMYAVFLSLCFVSVMLYIRATFWHEDSSVSSMASAASASSPRSTSRMAKDDSSLGLATVPRQPKPQLARRGTVIVAELKHKHWTINDADETMSHFTFVVNMFADLCPPGFLPLAAGLKSTGFVPGLAMLFVFYGLCVYTMFAIAKTTEITGAKDFAGQWTRTFGQQSSWIPVAVVVAVCFGCTLSYTVFFADIFASVTHMSRSTCLVAFTLFPTLPLCLLKNLSALSHSSTFALLAVLYTAGVMVVRAVDGTYREGGKYFAHVPQALAPNVPTHHLFDFGLPSLGLVNALALAFLSHYNGCKYYRELKQHTPSTLVKCTATAMGISSILFAITMVAGFQTFGINADSVILTNYAENDKAATIARLGVGLSIIASFPLMFSGLREAIISLLKHRDPINASDWDVVWRQDAVAMMALALNTTVALLVTDAGVVVGLVGAICGSAIIYIVPCSLYAAATQGFLTDGNSATLAWLKFLIGLGCVLAVAGCVTTILF
mmetsp:Transcript_82726/g.208162  ORF Transcript_82726/g.208162 Transcript_82726/m.208162 type:complete len:630 (+) Transcript_82726:56-1945(+)